MGCGVSRVGGGGPAIIAIAAGGTNSGTTSSSSSSGSSARASKGGPVMHSHITELSPPTATPEWTPHSTAPNTAREEGVRLAMHTEETGSGRDTTLMHTPLSKPALSTVETPVLPTSRPTSRGFSQSAAVKPSFSLSRQDTAVAPSFSRQASADAGLASNGSTASTTAGPTPAPAPGPVLREAPPARSRTFGRRNSFGGGLLAPANNDEMAWRNPRHAQELINLHLGEDPQCFRDHIAIYWRIEHLPTGKAAIPHPATPTSTPTKPPPHTTPLQSPIAVQPTSSILRPRISIHRNVTPGSPCPSPPICASSAPPSTPILPDQVTVFLSLGPSSGAGDKIGSSEYRPAESSISYFPMLLPYHALNGGDPAFSIQAQVWQKRVSGNPLGGGVTMTLLGYVDVSVTNMFSSFEKGQGLLLKSPPASVLAGQAPVPLPGTMLIVDYIQFYCHTTPAVTATPSRWPHALCTPASDCLWRGQIHAIKLGVPRGCPHPNVAGSMSPANGALMLTLKDMAATVASGVCFFHIFRQAPASAPSTTASPQLRASTSLRAPSPLPAGSTHFWQLIHTSEFLSLTRNPKFGEFQRPLVDICCGSYDLPLLIQVVLSHDPVRPGDLSRAMPADGLYADPAHGVTQAIRLQGLAVCSIVHTITTMRELLAGKTKLKLHAPGTAPFPAVPDETLASLHRSNTFNFDSGAAVAAAAAAGLFVEDPPQASPSSSMGHGTLAFNISQIFSSRASLEALARAKLADAEKTPANDGFEELGVVRSTAFLASMLPVGRRGHHRQGSHLRGPSVMGDFMGGHHGHTGSIGGPMIQRSKTAVSPSSGSLNAANIFQGMGSSSSGMGLLEKMGIASDSPTLSAPTTERRGSKLKIGLPHRAVTLVQAQSGIGIGRRSM